MQHPKFANDGLQVNGQRIKDISYVDDKFLIGASPQQLQRMMYID